MTATQAVGRALALAATTPKPQTFAAKSNETLLPVPVDLASDPEGLNILYALTSDSGRSQASMQKSRISQNFRLRDEARTKAQEALRKQQKEAEKKKEGGGLFSGFKSLVSNIVDNVVHLRPLELTKDIVKDLKTTVDVTNPQFWKDIGSIAKTYGKLVAVGCAIAASVVTGGAFAVACAVAVAVCMATSIAMEEAKMADRLNLSTELRMGISIGCTVVAAAASFGAGATGQMGALGSTLKGVRAAGAVVDGVGTAAEQGANIAVAKFEHTLALLGADTKEAQNNARQAAAQASADVELLAQITESYEKSKSVLLDAMAEQQQARTMILNGARA